MKKYKAIIFDMDGTLFDTERISVDAWFKAGEKFNLPVTEEFCLKLTGRNRISAQPIFKAYMPDYFNEDEVYAYRREVIEEYKKIHGPLPKGDLKHIFSMIKSQGYKLALCSSSYEPSINLNLGMSKTREYFDVIVNGSMVERGKPAPDIYLLTAQKLGVKSEECLVFEDSENGILSAHKAGMDVMMVLDLIEPTDEMRNICLKIYEHLDDIVELFKE